MFNFKKQLSLNCAYIKRYFALAISILALLTIFPLISLAQTPPATPAICASETSAKETACKSTTTPVTTQTAGQKATAKLEARKKCDTATLALDQCNLKTIRENEDVKKAAELCKSQYTPKDDGSSPSPVGLYVPVYEVGELLNLTRSTNKLTTNIDTATGRTYEMEIKLCMYLAAIKRVQYAIEDLTFIQEPDMRRQAATKIEEYKKGLLGPTGLIQTGYQPSGKLTEPATTNQVIGVIDKTTLYPENLNSYLSDARDEGYGVFMDNYNNYSSNSFKGIVSAQLKIDEVLGGTESLDSTIPKEIYANFVGPDSNNLSSDDWWGTFNSMLDITRPNNPYTAYMYAKEELDAQKSQTQSLAEQEYLANGGFLPVRTCIAYTTDGQYCRVWKTITPGQIVQQSANDALKTRLDMYTNPALGQVGPGNEPSTNEVQTFTPSTGTGGGTIGGTGGTGGGSNNGGGSNGGGEGGENPVPPAVEIASYNNPAGTTRTITWMTANTTSCAAQNDWLGATDVNNKTIRTIRSGGQIISTASGQIVTYIPYTFQLSWSKNSDPFSLSKVYNYATTTDGVSIKIRWVIPSTIAKNDGYSLKIQDGDNPDGYLISVNNLALATPKGVLDAFRDYQSKNSTASIYQRYDFQYNYGAVDPDLRVSPKTPIYNIQCVGTNGVTVNGSTAL